jgi:hypothetical protein
MHLQPLTPNDKAKIERYLQKKLHSLASYAFESIFIWRPHFKILWQTINKKLCIFYKDSVGCFMILPPLGGLDAKTVGSCFDHMEGINCNRELSRIENIEEDELEFFKKNDFRVYEKSKDYVVRTQDMAVLEGDRFRHKRNLVNFFNKNNGSVFRAYKDRDMAQVLELYNSWMRGRKDKNSDSIYTGMMEDSRKALCALLKDRRKLNVEARVVECGGRISAFTSGFPVSRKLFCINFEFADLSFKGIAQFIFNAFAKELAKYPEINIMDDSGIDNIRNTKLSYRPSRTVLSYTALLNI